MSKDEQLFVTSHYNGVLSIFEKSGQNYIVRQNISHPSAFLTGVEISEDKTEIFVGTGYYELLIYRDNGTQFLLAQNISISIYASFISHISNKVHVSGFWSKVLFLEFDGTQYQLMETVITPAPLIG